MLGTSSLTAACGRTSTGSAGDAEAVASAGLSSGPARGDRVVVEVRAAEFIEARVLAVRGDRLQLEPGDGGTPLLLPRADVYDLGHRAPGPSPGELAICRLSAGEWAACRVDTTDAAAIVAHDLRGRRVVLPLTDVLTPTPLTRLNLERSTVKEGERASLGDELSRVRAPESPLDWRPRVRDPVLVAVNRRWYSATVQEIEKRTLFVRRRGAAHPSEVNRSDVLPSPPIASLVAARGQHALVRPVGEADAWDVVKITAVHGDVVTVAGVQGGTRDVTPGDLYPLDEAPTGSLGAPAELGVAPAP